MIRKYILNCFLLIIPILLWNIVLIDYLPVGYSSGVFDKDIPSFIQYSEISLRFVVFGLPIFMVLSLTTRLQKIGLIVYLLGVALYFSSWLAMIVSPSSDWSSSLLGFMAPAYSTIVFFVGIGLIGNKAFFKFPRISAVYIASAFLFVVVHSAHAYVVFTRL